MASQCPVLSSRLSLYSGPVRRQRFVCGVVAMMASVTSCGGQLPTAPATGLLTISGYVYQETPDSGEPRIGNALITVTEAGGSEQMARSDGDGFYIVSVRAGTISIAASKDGYATKASEVAVLSDTVLNFRLMPS